MTTIEEFYEAARNGGLGVSWADKGVNVWADPTLAVRYPDDTIWQDSAGFVWGPSFEHTAPADTPATELVRLVAATLERPSLPGNGSEGGYDYTNTYQGE